MFCVVETEDEEGRSVEVVPESWILSCGRRCHWPPIKNPTKKIAQNEDPDPIWPTYTCRVLKKYGSYLRARQASKAAEYTSDLQSESDTPKRRRTSIPARTLPYTMDSSDEEPSSGINSALKWFPSPPLRDENGGPIFEIREVLEADNGQASAHLVELLPSTISTVSAIPLIPSVSPSRDLAGEMSSHPELSLMLDLVKRLVQDIALIKVTVKNNENRLQRIEKAIGGMERLNFPEDSKMMPKQPLSSEQEMLAFEDSITEENKPYLNSEMIRCGGDSLVEFVGRVLRKLITDELGLGYSMWGLKGNRNFSATKIWNILQSAALSIRKFEPTEKEISKAASEWFRHCSDRIKQRKKKAGA